MMMIHVLSFISVTTWLITCVVVDWRTGKIPNALTLPVMVIGIVLTSWRVVTNGAYNDPLILSLLWILFYAGWAAHWYGGGDAKLRMALAALWPSVGLLVALLISAIFAGVLVMVTDYRRSYPIMSTAFTKTYVGISSRRWDLMRSDRAELHRLGRRGAWEIALGGIAYAAYVLLF